MLRRLTYDGDYLMMDVIGATPAAQCRRADIPTRVMGNMMLRRLTHDGDYLMIDVIGATSAAQCRRAHITRRVMGKMLKQLTHDGDYLMIDVILCDICSAMSACRHHDACHG